MTKEQIVKKLTEIYNMLDGLQEEDLIQNLGDEGAANSIHESMGHIDNAIDELEGE